VLVAGDEKLLAGGVVRGAQLAFQRDGRAECVPALNLRGGQRLESSAEGLELVAHELLGGGARLGGNRVVTEIRTAPVVGSNDAGQLAAGG